MLIEFTVKNYRSIKQEQSLSMVKAKGDELELSNTFQPEAPGTTSLLRSAVIYGPNAAGKSNLIRAMMEMESIVRGSASGTQAGDHLSVEPFLFDEATANEPSEFEATFISEGVKYQYGFTLSQVNVIEEWLIAFPKGRPQRWFSRRFNEKKQSSEFKFSEFLSGQKSVWKNATRNNALFLSTAVQLNSEQLKPVFDWFRYKLRPTYIGGWGSGFTASLCEDNEQKGRVLEFLRAADFDIHDVRIEKEKFNPDSLPDEFPDLIKKEIANKMKDSEVFDIQTVHQTKSGRLIELDFEEESDGTKKIFAFAGPWIDTLNNGYVLVIDELHDNLHPRMVRYLVDLFNNKEINKKNAQLIFTTHDTSILSQEVFRRDQVWFCEKDDEQATVVYPLTDFSPRKLRENIEQGYLSGRYGAFPFVSAPRLAEVSGGH